jgi:NifU-like protein involved in Fe-S cluster formation
LLEVLDGLPKEHQHCAKLAVNTFEKVIKNYYEKKKEIK